MIARNERRRSTQAFRDHRIGFRHAQHDQRAPEPIDVCPFPRFTRHEILGNGPRFGGLSGAQIGVGQLRLRIAHRGLEAAIDADFHELQERGNVSRAGGSTNSCRTVAAESNSRAAAAASTAASRQMNAASGDPSPSCQASSTTAWRDSGLTDNSLGTISRA